MPAAIQLTSLPIGLHGGIALIGDRIVVFGPATALQKRQSWLPDGVTCNEARMKLGNSEGGSSKVLVEFRLFLGHRQATSAHARPGCLLSLYAANNT
jgi:hypothetical protein